MRESEIIVDNFAGGGAEPQRASSLRVCAASLYGYGRVTPIKKCVKSYALAQKVCKNKIKRNLREG